MSILVLCNVILLTSRDFHHHHFYYWSSFCGFPYLLTSFFGIFLRKFDGHIFKFLQSSVCESTSIISGSQTRKRRTVTSFYFQHCSVQNQRLSMLCPLEIFPPTQEELRALTMWPGSSEQPHLRAKSAHEKTVWKLQLHPNCSWRPSGYQDAGAIAGVILPYCSWNVSHMDETKLYQCQVFDFHAPKQVILLGSNNFQRKKQLL